MKPKSATIKAIASLLVAAALGAALPVLASTFTVGGSGSNFTITRLGDTSAAETVHYRTVPLSAFPGQHYTVKSDTLVFAPGQPSTNIVVATRTPSADAYKYQTGSASRSYRFELTDRAGALLASKDGSVSSGLTQVSQNYVSSNITDLVKFNGSSLTSGMGSSKYYDVSYSPSSNGNHVMTDGYIKIDDGYDYDNHTLCTIPTSAFFTQTKGSQDYFDSLGCKLYATVYFTMKEVDDGYQYIQILADNATSKDGKDPDGGVNTPSTSIYKACFELSKGSGNYPGTVTTDHYQAFPHRTDNHTSSTEFDYADAYLYAQAFKDNTPSYRAAKSGSLVLSPKVNAVNVRFDANGGGDDTWLVKNLKVRFALCDSTRPTKLADPVVAPGPYRYGTTFYVSIPFREIVTVTGTPTLHTDWGDLSYFFGSGSNVLTFKGVIDADYGENLVVRTLSGTITDLAGNELATPLSVYKEFSCTVDYPWAGSGTEAYPYVITTTNQLGYLAARVNAAYGDDDFAGKYFVLAADLDYGGTSDWDGYPDNTSGNNFTPVGCFGRSFKGHFDGQGHTVSGIRLDKQGADEDERSSVGLFGFVSGGSVRNIVLRDSKFQGDRNVGGIVGYLSGGTVTNCTLYHVLAGTKWVGRSSSAGAGIVVGHDDGTVSGCHYRDCRVGTTYREETGLGGSAFPMVHNDRVDNVFAVAADAGVAVTPATVDGVVIDGASYYAAGSTFDLSYSGAVPANWSVVYAPTGGAAVNGDTLVLAAADATVTASVAPPDAYAAHWQAGADHDGTSDKPYVITTPEGLQMLSAEVNAGTGFSGTYFRLGADIDMGDVANFDPIGPRANKPFAGHFDGDGRTISGLVVNIGANFAGLFGYVTGSVANLTLCGATITGEDYVGGIVGALYSSDARLTGCRVVGSVVTATLATDKVPQTGAIVGGGVIVSSATGNTYHSTIVRAPNATGGDFHADGDAFNVGVGSYYAPLHSYGDIGPSGATLDPSCLLLPTNAPAVRAALIAAYADPAAHTAHGGATPDLSGLVVTSGVTRLYAVTNCTPVGLSVSGTDVVLAGLGRSYFAPGDAVALVPPAGFAIVAASYTDASGTHAIEPAAALAYAFPMPDSDVSVAATLAATFGYCGRADANGGENVVWNFDPATGALAVGTNAAAVGTDFAMADYTWSGSANTPWTALRPYIRSISIAPGVVSVGDYAFCECRSLDSLSIGGDVVSIGENAFSDCSVLESVSIPGSVATIGRSAFRGCVALATVEGGANVTRVGYDAFGSLFGSDDYTTPWLRAQPAGVVYFGKVAIAFQKNGADTAVEIAAGTVSIAECAFNSSPVTSIVLPESVAHIGKQAFGMCDYLAAVYLLSAAPPALDDPDYLFTVEGDEQSNPDQIFYVRGTAYADAWSGVWDWMADNSNWTDAKRIAIGTVSCADGITASGAPVLTHGGTNYYAAGSAIALGGVPPAPNPVPAGYTDQLAGYAVNGLPVGVSFAMPERDATVTPRWAVVDFEVGHTGTEQDPYVIYNKDQLDLLAARVNGGKNYSGKFIRLGADIAYDPTALDENGENYTAIGDYNHEFQGNFDGDGHTVRGIRINKTGDSDADEYQGLFGRVCDGTIRNVTLADSVVIGYRYVGGVVGYQYFCGAIANCRVESDVILGAGCDGADFCGGIVGYTFASVRVRGCLSAATVTDRGKSGCDYYGGIVGWCSSPDDDVQDCLVLGGTVAARGKLGAIAGKKNNEGSFTNNYYAACTVNGMTNATNVGCGDPAGDIDGARYAHTITLGPGVRIVGEEMVYSVSGLTAIGTSALRYTGGGTNVIYGGAGQTVALAYDGVVPEGYAFVGYTVAMSGGSVITISTLNPQLSTFTMPDADVTVRADIAAIPWSGGGTAEDPYLIQYPSQLDLLAANVNGGVTNYAGAFFLQIADLVYESTTNNYRPVGYGVFAFGGTYDGGGHIVSGINVTWTDGFDGNNSIGLFGNIDSGIVRNVTVADSVFAGNGEAGGVAGYVVEAVVSNCCVEGSVVIGTGAVQTYCHGGIVGGGTSSAIVGCFSAAAVTSNAGDECFGGIAGLFYGGRIENCLYGGTVLSEGGYVGAILGDNAYISTRLYNNLYTADGLPGGFNGNDTDGARRAHTITLGEGVSLVGEETVYDVSGLAAIGTSALRYTGGGTNVIYGGAGETVTLVYDGVPPEGYAFVGFVVNGVAVDGDSFEMPDADVTVAAEIVTEWAALNRRLAAGGDITLAKDYAATAEDGPLTVPAGVAVTLDLNGHILDRGLTAAADNGYVIEVIGTLTVTDSAPAAAHSPAVTYTDPVTNSPVAVTGGIITGGYNSNIFGGSNILTGGGVCVANGAAFTLSGGTVAGNSANSFGGGVFVGYKAAFTMTGGSITGNEAAIGYGGGVYNQGTFTLISGTISQNTTDSHGGGVYNAGTFEMNGGTISGNETPGYSGGGVYSSGTFEMTDGTISQNIACNGGGVYVGYGTFTMDDGSISGNTVVGNGGGVYVEGGTFTMNDGAISDNTASECGGGVCVNDYATFTLTGGAISGNACGTRFFFNGGGVCMQSEGGAFQISGSPMITGNTRGADGPANNVYLDGDRVITVTGELSDTARIGVTMETSGVFTSGLSGNGTEENFASDNPYYGVYYNQYNNEAALGRLYAITVTPASGGTVTAPERAPAGGSVTITVTPEAGYVLTSLTVTDENDQPVAVDENNRFTMPYSDVTVTADFLPPMTWASLNEALQSSGTVILHNDVTAEATDGFLTVPKSVSVTLDLNGHILDRALTEATANGFVIRVNGGLTVTDSDPTAAHSGTEVTGGVITGGYNSSSGSGGGNVVDGGGVYVGSGGTFTMTDGTIVNNTAAYGGGVYVNEGGAFTMAGGTISENAVTGGTYGGDAPRGGGVYVDGGTFTMTGGTICSNKVSKTAGYGGGVYVVDGAFTMNGGIIIDNDACQGGGVYMDDVAFEMTGGSISNNYADKHGGGVCANKCTVTISCGEISGNVVGPSSGTIGGGGVYVYSSSNSDRSTFTMTGGEISGNVVYASGSTDVYGGGGVYVNEYGTFAMSGGSIISNSVQSSGRAYGGGVCLKNNSGTGTMTGGTISGNFVDTTGDGGSIYAAGGGMFVNKCAFTMSGGEISGNWSSKNGGGVAVGGIGYAFVMTGGEISGNTAKCLGIQNIFGGGGVYVNNNATFAMTNSVVSGNVASKGGGVFVNNGTFKVSGVSVVSGNTNSVGAAANVYLPSGKEIAVDGLSADASIGVTTAVRPTESLPLTFATGAAASDDAHFFSDDPSFRIGFENGTLRLFLGTAYPAYLAGAEESVTNNWLAWAGRHGAVTNDEYEAAFLLDVAPAALSTCTGALLRVSAFAPTAAGARLELACDIPGYRFFQPEGDDVTALGNGYVGLVVARDLATLAGETRPIPVLATVDATMGRAVIDLDFALYLQALGVPPGFTPPLPESLFARPVLTPVRPDLEAFILVVAEP